MVMVLLDASPCDSSGIICNGVHPLNKIWRPGIKNAKREPGLSRAFLNMGNLNINGAKWGKNW